MSLSDTTKAALLIRYGLDPQERPTPDSDYRDLLDRYRTDAEFAELTSRIADGLGLYLRGVTPLGLVLAGDVDGPFAVSIETSGLPIRSGERRLQDRRCFGLVLTALAAFAYPTGEDLVSTTNPTVRPEEFLRFINRHVKALADLGPDADELDAQLGEAARSWQDLPEILPGERGDRLRRDCQRYYVERTLDYLVSKGRARREPALSDERGDAFALNDRFRIGLSEVCETVAFAVLTGRQEAQERELVTGPAEDEES